MRDADFAELAEKARPDIEKIRVMLSRRRDDIARQLDGLRRPLPEPPELTFARRYLAQTQQSSFEGYNASRRLEGALKAIPALHGWRKWLPWIRAEHRRRIDAAQEALRQTKEQWLTAADRQKGAQADVDYQLKKWTAAQHRHAEACLAEERRLRTDLDLVETAEIVLRLRPELARRGTDEVLAAAAERLRDEEARRLVALNQECERQHLQDGQDQHEYQPPVLP